jgi:coenzyme Q-binding protein COQ10
MTRHDVERVLPYDRELLFDIAADVERYPEFLPAWTAARITRREGNVYWTDQSISLGPLRARFGTETVLNRPERIEVVSSERPFRFFRLCWIFEPRRDGHTRVILSAQLDLRSTHLERMVGPILRGITAATIAAFEARAARLHGGR